MLEVRLLGKFEVRMDGQIVEIPLRATQSLLAYLIFNAGTPHRRAQLAGLFWPDRERP
jgi:DNA-binding SARP family transcriptional activator